MEDQKPPITNPVIPTPVTPPPPSPTPAPAQPEKPKIDLIQKNIRTYESDIAEALAKKKTSVAQIAIAQSEKNTGAAAIATIPRESFLSKYGKKLGMFVVSIALIAGGSYGGYYLYKQSAFGQPAPLEVIVVPKSLIPTDKQLVVNPATSKMTGPEFLTKLNGSVPDILIRSLTDRWMLGSFTDEETGNKTPFIALTTDFFQNAFAGMLQWEEYMSDDLAGTFGYDKASGSHGHFEDKVIKNRDVREFIGNANQTLFVYSFVDKNTIIITPTQTALTGIVERIEKQTYVR